jgi:HD-like signal output (HDOD) protein/CheY-like chemotaxis protein
MSDIRTVRRVLFVDDEPNVLAGLQRMLRPMRKDWEMHFVTGGADALDALAGARFDVIVSDMRMPGLDGAGLLDEVSRTHPDVVRIVLSGQANQESILRVVGPAHQYLSKPCDAEALKAKLRQAFVLRDVLSDPAVTSLVARLRSLPSVPAVYVELMNEMRTENASLRRIGQIIEQDVAMTAKILQLVNSAFFGVRTQVASVAHAVQLLGLDLVRTLMLSAEIVSQLDGRAMKRFRLSGMWQHSLVVSRFVRLIARLERIDDDTTGHAVTAAMLHDAGRLVLASCLPDEYGAITDRAARERQPLAEIEHEVLGCTHAEVGAYLLGLWGLPDPVTVAVAWHHRPSASGAHTLGPLALVHAADALAGQLLPERDDVPVPPDHEFLASLPASGNYAEWKLACAAQGDGGR